MGIVDAAQALIAAETNGRVGQRYIVAERWLDFQELFAIAAEHAGRPAPTRKIPLWVLYLVAGTADLVSFFTRSDNKLSVASLRCSTLLPNVSPDKARQQLGWQPRPVEESVREAVDYYLVHP